MRTSYNTGIQTLTLRISVEAEGEVARGARKHRVETCEMNIHFGCITNGWIYGAQSVS
jgi:hypothetical protein